MQPLVGFGQIGVADIIPWAWACSTDSVGCLVGSLVENGSLGDRIALVERWFSQRDPVGVNGWGASDIGTPCAAFREDPVGRLSYASGW